MSVVTRAPVSTCTPISVSMSCTASPHRWHRHSRAAWRRVAAMPPLSTPLLATTMQNGLGEEKFFHCRWVLAQKFKLTGSWAKAAAGSFFLGGGCCGTSALTGPSFPRASQLRLFGFELGTWQGRLSKVIYKPKTMERYASHHTRSNS